MAKLVGMKSKIKIELNNDGKVKPLKEEIITDLGENKNTNNSDLMYMKLISYFEKKSEGEEKDVNLLIKWSFAASVIDRFCFYVSLIYSVITFIGIILINPNFYNFN
jgi:hypothetical protein